MAKNKALRYRITYKNAEDNSFAEVIHKRTKNYAITTAKVFVLTEHLRYGRDLNAEIIDELHPRKPAIVILLTDMLIN